VGRVGLTRARLFGLDRSGPPPPETLPGAPWRPWTIPNAIGYLRAALIPAFLILEYGSRHGTNELARALFFIAGGADYLDGIAARLSGQYSRLGTVLDPLVDRALVIAGAAVCWSFELLPRWILAVLVARELVMLVAGELAVRRGLTLKINWPGRIAVAPTMFGVWLGLLGVRGVGAAFVYAGVTLAWVATLIYFRDARHEMRVSMSD
jgi:cardiolipin synthase